MKIVIFREYGFNGGVKMVEFIKKTDKTISYKESDKVPSDYRFCWGTRINRIESKDCKIVDLESNKDRINEFMIADREIREKIKGLEEEKEALIQKLFSELI